MKLKMLLVLVFAVSFIIGGVSMSQAATETVTTKTCLKYQDEKLGTGKTAEPGKIVFVNYTGWLYDDGKKGKKFDSSLDRGKPFEFKLGKRMVIAGWDEGVAGMKEGGKRTLIIPSALGYGARGFPPVIPSNATLIFDVELVEVK
jgi:peptidylprolyl isomerase